MAFNMPLYFAYGSNMDLNQIVERCPSAKFHHPAVARGFRLAFTRFSEKRQCGVADLIADASEEVWGAVFKIAGLDIPRLDRGEGVFLTPPAYRRMPIKVFPPGGHELRDAFTYEVVAEAARHLKPNVAYVGLIVGGAVRWGLPEQYIEKLRKIEVC